MIVMGLDVSTVIGVAVVSSEEREILHTEELTAPRKTGLPRAADLVGGVVSLCSKWDPDFLVIEGYGFANSHTLATLVEVGTVVRYFMWQDGHQFLLVPPPSLKKFVTGDGHATKDRMMLSVFKNWGHEAKTNNTADAVGLAMFGLGCAGITHTKAQVDCCTAVLRGQPEFEAWLRGYIAGN
jgi:Holliday junction resolvasome RuvABC endonuclease subunit